MRRDSLWRLLLTETAAHAVMSERVTWQISKKRGILDTLYDLRGGAGDPSIFCRAKIKRAITT